MIDPQSILTQLEQLDKRVKDLIAQILGNNPTQEQMLAFLASDEFDKLIEEAGLTDIVAEYMRNFDIDFSNQIENFRDIDLKAQQIELISRNVEVIKNTNARTVLGYASANSELLRTKLINSIINGVDAQQTLKELETIPLTTAQLGSVISTSYADFSRSVTAQVFENKPEQRFRYVAGIPASAPQKSEICRWLLENQKPEGYTRAEIDAGIVTSFGIVNWGGRLPNYNCTDQWMPI